LLIDEITSIDVNQLRGCILRRRSGDFYLLGFTVGGKNVVIYTSMGRDDLLVDKLRIVCTDSLDTVIARDRSMQSCMRLASAKLIDIARKYDLWEIYASEDGSEFHFSDSKGICISIVKRDNTNYELYRRDYRMMNDTLFIRKK
jgi:hypothetical protein